MCGGVHYGEVEGLVSALSTVHLLQCWVAGHERTRVQTGQQWTGQLW